MSPIGGLLGHMYNRAWVVSLGCLVWGLTTTAFSFTHNVGQGIATWAITGIGLCLVIPNVQSITADYFDEGSRGTAFGILYLTSAGGAAVATLWATNIGGQRVWGWEGWRFAILLLGISSCLVGVLNLGLARDPRCPRNCLRQEAPPRQTALSKSGAYQGVAKEVGSVLVIPTFIIIILQGIVGNIPGTALGFVTLYVQLLGLSDMAAGLMVALGMAANAVGGLLGGWLGDLASWASPNHGRVLICQVSIVGSMPACFRPGAPTLHPPSGGAHYEACTHPFLPTAHKIRMLQLGQAFISRRAGRCCSRVGSWASEGRACHQERG
eukprot:jgi/Botrbrau1/12049/Bobra.0295s0005.1